MAKQEMRINRDTGEYEIPLDETGETVLVCDTLKKAEDSLDLIENWRRGREIEKKRQEHAEEQRAGKEMQR